MSYSSMATPRIPFIRFQVTAKYHGQKKIEQKEERVEHSKPEENQLCQTDSGNDYFFFQQGALEQDRGRNYENRDVKIKKTPSRIRRTDGTVKIISKKVIDEEVGGVVAYEIWYLKKLNCKVMVGQGPSSRFRKHRFFFFSSIFA